VDGLTLSYKSHLAGAFVGPNTAGSSSIRCTGSRQTAEPGSRSSRFEAVVRNSSGLSRQRQAVLGVLLGSSWGCKRSDLAVLQPLWANEAMQRACDMVRLMAALDAAVPASHAPRATFSVESRLAGALATAYQELSSPDERELVACSGLLRTVIRGLVELFGEPFGVAKLQTNIERLTMPAFQRRALVLAASSLLLDAFREAISPVCGINIELGSLRPGVTRFRIIIVSTTYPGPACSDNLLDLASLLDDSCIHSFSDAGKFAVELYFRPPDISRASPIKPIS
jgi:hypothetical protein